jgi:formiminotetrahydrofolate cyclodeaminase
MVDSLGPVSSQTLETFGEALASDAPAPGGGAAAAVVAALGSSLIAMVARLSLDRPRYAAHAALHVEAIERADAARLRLLELADADASAYDAYLTARRLPRDTEDQRAERTRASQAAAREASQVPLAVVKLCHEQVDLTDRLVGRTNLNVASDLEVGGLLLESAARSAAANVRINVGSVGDEGYATAVVVELDQRLQSITSTVDRARERIARGLEREPEAR